MIDDFDENDTDGDDYQGESEDDDEYTLDVEMQNMEANRGDHREYDEDMGNGMINDEIEDIESDEDN